jgi:hypothetical protein
MKVITAPKYEAASTAHLVTTEVERVLTELAKKKDLNTRFVQQPVSTNMPYLPEEHLGLLNDIADGKVDTLVVIGRPATLKNYENLKGKTQFVLLCTPVLEVALDDYEGLNLLADGKCYVFDKFTENWVKANSTTTVEMVKLGLPFYKSWVETKKDEGAPLRILNITSASLSRMVAANLAGVELVTSESCAEAVRPKDENTTVVPTTTVVIGETADCFVLDKSMTIETVMTYLSQGMYPVTGAQFEETILREIGVLFGKQVEEEYVIRVFPLSPTVPPEAIHDLKNFGKIVEDYREGPGTTIEALVATLEDN